MVEPGTKNFLAVVVLLILAVAAALYTNHRLKYNDSCVKWKWDLVCTHYCVDMEEGYCYQQCPVGEDCQVYR